MTGQTLKRIILRRMREAKVRPDIVARASRIRFPGNPRRILGKSIKVAKNRKHGMETSVLYLAPHRLSVPFGGRNLCPWATTCADVCLGILGRLGPGSDGENAELWKTLTYVWARSEFLELLSYDIHLLRNRARSENLQAGVRLNGSSDVVWERVFPMLFELFSDVTFYDYTKSFERMFRPRPANYHLTYSFDGRNLPDCLKVLRSRQNVAIVITEPKRTRIFKRKLYYGFPLINGDEHDCRPSDAKGVWVVLSPKGHANDTTGFFL